MLIGRRDLRCSNSFMHNLPALVKGRDRCTLQISRADAEPHRPRARRLRPRHQPGREPGGAGRGQRRPHARRRQPAARLGARRRGRAARVAKAHAGVNTNVLTDDQAYDVASGTAVLFGTPVRVEPVAVTVE